MVGRRSDRRRQLLGHHQEPDEDAEDPDARNHFLIDRILARTSQKAKQLGDYCAPVVLAITVPEGDEDDRFPRSANGKLDLRRLAGSITMMLPVVRQLSAILISLWDVEPAVARSGVRLANVSVVERPRHQKTYPRVRLLILNHAAGFPLAEQQIKALKGLL
jgi:hypothetical protein